MQQKILLITPPFTQFNTPYPATAYLKGYLNTIGVDSVQADLGLEVILEIFSSTGLSSLFHEIEKRSLSASPNTLRMIALKNEYIETIDIAMAFLQGGEQSMAHLICERDFLPEASRFADLEDLEWAFGTMGMRDKARYLITLYLEDISDLIKEAVDPRFGFSRYAEHLGRMASSFDCLYEALCEPTGYLDTILLSLLARKIENEQPDVVAISIPFPGNLYSALRCGAHIKKYHPSVKVVMGGGFVSTELRSLTDSRFFNFADYLILDDGELPLKRLLSYLAGQNDRSSLVRTFISENDQVRYINDAAASHLSQSELGIPDYEGLSLQNYLSVIEMVNPMHRLWSDGRWNKLTLAHGCYWGKCSFCDGTLDYIGRYAPNSAKEIVDKMELLIQKTGERGFHFVDEAAPPALLKEVAQEIIGRKLFVVWWTNIRFEKSFTNDLARLMRLSGCIAVSGGLEVASDRLLKLINKGVTVEQVTRVTDALTTAGIMVHAYLMYGFPTETAQETIDSLEIVRQMFDNGLIQSGFWHRFALTAHSPVSCDPEKYAIKIMEQPFKGFARNDLDFVDSKGANHDDFGAGLSKALFNYMHGAGFDIPLQKWFDVKVPHTQMPPQYIECILNRKPEKTDLRNKQLLWLGKLPQVRQVEKHKKGKNTLLSEWVLQSKTGTLKFDIRPDWGEWLYKILPGLSIGLHEPVTFGEFEKSFPSDNQNEFELFLSSPLWTYLRENDFVLV